MSNRSIYGLSAFRALAENMARVAVYYFMWVHGFPVAVAIHAALSYFGSAAGESLIQSLATSLTGRRELPMSKALACWLCWATA